MNSVAPKSRILLATARVRVYSVHGRFARIRALIDQGSVALLITKNLAQRLRTPRYRNAVCVTGIGETQTAVRQAAKITVTPIGSDSPAVSTTALILKSLTRYVSNQCGSAYKWPHLDDLPLADPDPMAPDPIDLIIGADLYGALILDGVRKGSDDQPIAQNTLFGWIISGPIGKLISVHHTLEVHHGSVLENLDLNL